MLIVVVGGLRAQEGRTDKDSSAEPGKASSKAGPEQTDGEPVELVGPWTFAPQEHVVAPRDPYGFRKKGTLISKAYHNPVFVDEDQLREKRLALYGQSETHQPQDDGSDTPTAPIPVATTTRTGNTGWWVFLGFISASACTIAVTFILSRRKPQPVKPQNTVPFSAMRRVRKQRPAKKATASGLRSLGKPDPAKLRLPDRKK